MEIKTTNLENILDTNDSTFEENIIDEVDATNYSGILEPYFKPRAIERWKDGLVYKALGVGVFKKIVPTGGTYINRLVGYGPVAKATDKRKALLGHEPWTRVYETIHTPMILMAAPIMAEHILNGDYFDLTVVSNVLVNLYPILLQRYNRAKIYNYLDDDNSK